jgi:RimJ/RimL family protein N-acetyltransferase
VLSVVKITGKDYKLFVDWNKGKEENYLLQWAGPNVYHYPITIDQIKLHANEEFSQIYIILNNENPIGSIELEKINNETLSAHITRFILCDNAKNKGFGTLALKQLINTAFKELGLKKLTLYVFCFNVGAIRCYEKAGFLVKKFHQKEDAKWNYYTMEIKAL